MSIIFSQWVRNSLFIVLFKITLKNGGPLWWSEEVFLETIKGPTLSSWSKAPQCMDLEGMTQSYCSSSPSLMM